MTKVEIFFPLGAPADAQTLGRVAEAQAVYGIFRIQVEQDGVRVEFDATRLNPKEVKAALLRIGIPVQ